MSPSIEPFNEAKYKALMDGLKCKEILLSDTYAATDYFRLEPEYYNSTTVSYRKSLKGKDVSLNIQYGTSKFCDEQEGGYPVLRLNELHNAFIDTPQKYCHTLLSDEFEKLRLKKGDVLVIRTNGNPNIVGKAAVVLEDTDYAFASYLYRVNTNEQINPETLVAYLNCKYGRYEIDKNSIKGNQTNFSPAKFRDISIPKFDITLQKAIKNLFYKANQCRLNADSEFVSAEQMLISAIGFNDFEPDTNNVAKKPFSESYAVTGRLDAEYYLPRYDSYINKIGTEETVGSMCSLTDKNYAPNNETVYQYIELADVGYFGNIGEVEKVLGKDLPSRARRQVKAGQIIVASVEGSLQSCALITNGYDNALCSTGFYVLDSKRINSETLLVLFKSKPIQELLKQRCSGTILTAITKDELLDVPLPEIEAQAQLEIAKKVRESFALRNQSERLINLAKSVVEYAIEKDEIRAIKWLKEKGVEC